MPTNRLRRSVLLLSLLLGAGGMLLSSAQYAADLAIDEGVVVKFGADAGIVVRDTLQAGNRVTFTSLFDDSALGQTGASVGTPAAGDWRGVRFESSAIGTNQKLGDATFRFGGLGALEVRKTSPTFSYLSVSSSLTGIRITDGAAPKFDGLSLTNNVTGMEVDGDAAPVITKSQIKGNTTIGVTNKTPATIVQATGNWWGHASGPKDAVGNPNGQGDAVSTGVNYGSYQTATPLINPQLSVAGNTYFTEQPSVTLNLYCVNAVEYRLAEGGSFTGVAFTPMTASVAYTFSAGDGIKQISVQYRSVDGNLATATLPQGILFDTQGPSLNVTNPAADSYITKSITIEATASDPAGVAKVEFYVDGMLKANDSAAPYSAPFDLTGVADGAHTIKVVAFDAVGHSTTDTRTVNVAKEAPPPPDTAGPSTSNLKLSATGLIEGSTIVKSGLLTVSATDPSGVSRIEFYVDGVSLGTDTNGADGYSTYLDIAAVADGAHALKVVAYDSLNNKSTLTLNVTVAMAPPATPTITKPTNNLLTNQKQVVVTGTAEKLTQVQIYDNGTLVAGPANVDSAGNYSLTVPLVNGANSLQAAALNRGGASALSNAVMVTLDASIPTAPIGLTATGQASGKVRLTWTKPGDSSIAGYHLYRAPLAFNAVGEATKVNSNLITGTSFDDLPAADGTYFYRVVAANNLGTVSDPSNQASAISDNTQPKALSISYAPTGKTDPATGRISVGRVNLTVIVSEPLGTTPFLSIAPQNGVPISVELAKVTDTEYRGGFDITSITPSGTAYAVFSARDVVGNRGTEIVSGNTIKIDAKGPSVLALNVSPVSPIKNDATNPVSLSVSITLDEVVKPGTKPQLGYLRGTNTTPIAINAPTQVSGLTWSATLTLPADLGQSALETIKFTYSGSDDLDNVSTEILATNNSFQVYQGELPAVGVPTGLAAKAQPAGKVKLTWNAVTGAGAYQLYRQGPSESGLTAYQRVTAGTEYVDSTNADGLYRYAVASVRLENGQEALSDQSAPVQVTADATAPAAPQNLQLALTSIGIQATWQASSSADVVSYSLYRTSATSLTSTAGLTPIKLNIKGTAVIDPSPSLTEHTYAVVAVDAVGNESPLSNSAYLNASLLPVSTLTVVQSGADLPVISWTHSGNTIAGYDVFLGEDASKTKLNSARLTVKSYTDSGYANDERRYTVVAVDNNNAEIGRSIRLPKLSATLVAGAPIKRGLMNRLQYQVTNSGTNAVDNIALKLKVGTRDFTSTPFSLATGQSKLVPVVVGGFADIPNLVTVTTTIEVTPNEGESVKIVRTGEIEAQDGALVLSVATESFTRGATGKARFTLENTSDVETEIILALSSGNSASNQVRFKLLDKDGNVLATKAVKQVLGANVITLSSGITVARVQPGTAFTSDLTEMNVPSNAPESVTAQLEIDSFHYHLGQPDAVAIPGMSGRATIALIDTAYYGEVTSISPATSYGDQDVVIQGRAVNRATIQGMPSVPLRLVLRINGYERKYDVFTDASGNFSYTFKPQAGEAGIYKVSVVHPDILDRPDQGQFVINQLAVNPTQVSLNIPKNYAQAIPIRVTAGDGTVATNVRLTYEAKDQPSGSVPAGVNVSLSAPVTLGSKQSATLTATVIGDNSAATLGALVFKVMSDERGTTPVATVRVDYKLSDAKPTLYPSPSYIETGVARGESVSEQLTLENKGLAPADNVVVSLRNTGGTPAPGWIYLTATGNLGSINVGERRTVDIAVAPDTNVQEGIYSFKLHIAGDNFAAGDINVYVSVTQSGVGNVLFKASDIYTATLDKNGNIIQGLAGARIEVQNELVASVSQTLSTDSLGEALFSGLPAGRYKFRASATNHQEVIGAFDIKPGVTAAQNVFLDYNLITVDWSVQEITIEDKYEITLTATYQTQVPAAVVVIEPTSVNLPTMKAGDVFYGEFTITNYGLIRADDVNFALPASDANFNYELLAEVPTSLAAKQRVTIPYRVVSVASLDPGGAASGGGCYTYQKYATCKWGYTCSNGSKTSSSSSAGFFTTYGTCGSGSTSGGSSGGGGSGGSSSIGFGGPGGGLIGGGTSPPPSSIPGAKCIPTPYCVGPCCQGGGMPGFGDGPPALGQ